MAANAVKTSQLIAALQGVVEKFGDLDVVIPDQPNDTLWAVQLTNIAPQTSWPWKSVPRAVLAIGYSDAYTAAPAPDDGWSYVLDAAPEGERVRVMKRRGSEDVGYRRSDGVWLVYEGGERAWEIAFGGVIAWRAP